LTTSNEGEECHRRKAGSSFKKREECWKQPLLPSFAAPLQINLPKHNVKYIEIYMQKPVNGHVLEFLAKFTFQ